MVFHRIDDAKDDGILGQRGLTSDSAIFGIMPDRSNSNVTRAQQTTPAPIHTQSIRNHMVVNQN